MADKINTAAAAADPDHKKFFNSKMYNTLLLGSKSSKDDDSLVSLLCDPANKAIRHEVLNLLKKHNGSSILMDTISKEDDLANKRSLIAACWESGIDFSSYLPFFNEIVINGDLECCIEAMTVINEFEKIPAREDVIKSMDAINLAVSISKEPLKVALFQDMKVIYNDMLINLG